MNFLKLNKNEIQKNISQVFTAFDLFEKTTQKSVLPHYDENKFFEFSSKINSEEGSTEFLSSTLAELNKGTLGLGTSGYMGVFNPKPLPLSSIPAFINSLYNSQLASSVSAPFPIFAEEYLIKYFGERAGYDERRISGHFTSGGTEGNLSATLMALHNSFPQVKKKGLRSLKADPKIYASVDTHHSIQRASFVTGLGINSFLLKDLTISKD